MVIHSVTAIDLLNHIHSVTVARCTVTDGAAQSAGVHELQDGITEETDIVRGIDLNPEQTVKPVAAEPEEYEILLTLSVVLILNAQP